MTAIYSIRLNRPYLYLILAMTLIFHFAQAQAVVFEKPIQVEDHHIRLVEKGIDSIIQKFHQISDKPVVDSIMEGEKTIDPEGYFFKRILVYENDTLSKITEYVYDEGHLILSWTEDISCQDGMIFKVLTAYGLNSKGIKFREMFPQDQYWSSKLTPIIFKDPKTKRRIRVASESQRITNRKKLTHKMLVDSLEQADQMSWLYTQLFFDTNENILREAHLFTSGDGYKEVAYFYLPISMIQFENYDKNGLLIGRRHRIYDFVKNERGDWVIMNWSYAGMLTRDIFYR